MKSGNGALKTLCAAGLLAVAPIAAIAGTRPAVSTLVETVTIPFAPPVDQELKYTLTIQKSSSGKATTAVSRQELRFARANDGYLLHFKITDIRSDGGMIDLSSATAIRQLPPQLQPFLLPMTFDVARDGAIVRVHNWPSLQAAIARIPEMLTQQEPLASRAQLRAAIAGAINFFAEMNAEQAAPALLKGWPAMLGFGGSEGEDGASYEISTDVQVLAIPVSIPVTGRYSITRDPQTGRLRYDQSTKPDVKKSEAALAEYLGRLASNATDAKHRANIAKGIDAVRGMITEDAMSITFDAGTGLIRHGSSERRVTLPNGEVGSERLTIERIS